MIKIMLVDDHPIVRSGIVKVLSEDPNMSVVAEAQSAKQAMEKLDEITPDVVVLDITLPDESGLRVLEKIRLKYPKLPVLMLSMHPEEQYALMALKLGASGYLTKKSLPEELINAIRKVVSRGRYITESLAEKLADGVDATNAEKLPHEALAAREFQVMLMMASGSAPKEIAAQLCVSVKTINTYRNNILTKMSFSSNADIIKYAVKYNLLAQDE
ncbi:MAG: response regulator transcription factor [Candidatus Magnetominusculus sp. LBB02]|nr:response regulator transcription factor [Candidatus Magnetominusculus sp. LBB02]